MQSARLDGLPAHCRVPVRVTFERWITPVAEFDKLSAENVMTIVRESLAQ